MQLTAETRWEQSAAATRDRNGSTNRQPDRCHVDPLAPHAAAATRNEQKGSGGRGEEQTDVMTVLIRPQSGELLWKVWARARKLKAERLPRENKKTGGHRS